MARIYNGKGGTVIFFHISRPSLGLCRIDIQIKVKSQIFFYYSVQFKHLQNVLFSNPYLGLIRISRHGSESNQYICIQSDIICINY